MPWIISERMEQELKQQMSVAQAGYMKHRGTSDHTFSRHSLIQKCHRIKYLYWFMCFFDYSEGFDKTKYEKLWAVMVGFSTTADKVSLPRAAICSETRMQDRQKELVRTAFYPSSVHHLYWKHYESSIQQQRWALWPTHGNRSPAVRTAPCKGPEKPSMDDEWSQECNLKMLRRPKQWHFQQMTQAAFRCPLGEPS